MAVDTHLTPTARHTAGAIHTTVADGTDTDGIVMIGITADGVMVVDSVMKGMVVADMNSPIRDTVKGTITVDPMGHRISRTTVCREISRIVSVT